MIKFKKTEICINVPRLGENMKKYQVYLGVINYTITLNENNRIESLRDGNQIPYSRNSICAEKITDHIPTLKNAFRYMLVAEPEEFQNLCVLLKKNDPEMFRYLEEVLTDISVRCINLM